MEKKIEDNTIMVGKKDFLRYVDAIRHAFEKNKKITLKARGRNTSKAIDLSQALKNKFMKEQGIEIEEIKIDSEDFERKDEKTKESKTVSVSTLDIILTKK